MGVLLLEISSGAHALFRDGFYTVDLKVKITMKLRKHLSLKLINFNPHNLPKLVQQNFITIILLRSATSGNRNVV